MSFNSCPLGYGFNKLTVGFIWMYNLYNRIYNNSSGNAMGTFHWGVHTTHKARKMARCIIISANGLWEL